MVNSNLALYVSSNVEYYRKYGVDEMEIDVSFVLATSAPRLKVVRFGIFKLSKMAGRKMMTG